MIRVYDALKVDGKDDFVIHCYGVFYGQCVERAYDELKSLDIPGLANCYKLFDELESMGVVLFEVVISELENIPSAVLATMSFMYDSTFNCLASLCIYDGAFCEFEDIFSDEISSQIYAFSIEKNEPVITFDESVLSSELWKSLIETSKKRLFKKIT